MAGERLNATQRKHETSRRIAPVGTDRHRARHVEGGCYLAGGANSYPLARVDSDQGVMDEVDALAHRHSHVIHELQRRRAGAAFIAIDHDEIGIDSALKHRLADRPEFPGMADSECQPGRLAAAWPAYFTNEGHHLQRCREG